jgi:hypothetical protein
VPQRIIIVSNLPNRQNSSGGQNFNAWPSEAMSLVLWGLVSGGQITRFSIVQQCKESQFGLNRRTARFPELLNFFEIEPLMREAYYYEVAH